MSRLILWLAGLGGCGRVGFANLGDATGDAAGDGVHQISWLGTVMQTVPMTGATSVTVGAPSCPTGDMFVAVIAMGNTGATMMPGFTEPFGWTTIRRLDRGNDTTLLLDWSVSPVAELVSYTWTFDAPIEGVAWISCYAGVDPSSPIQAELGTVDVTSGPSYTLPTITTTTANAMVVATVVAHSTPMPTTWIEPAGTSLRIDVNNGTTRSGLGADLRVAVAGPIGVLTASASSMQDYALMDVLVLAPAP